MWIVPRHNIPPDRTGSFSWNDHCGVIVEYRNVSMIGAILQVACSRTLSAFLMLVFVLRRNLYDNPQGTSPSSSSAPAPFMDAGMPNHSRG